MRTKTLRPATWLVLNGLFALMASAVLAADNQECSNYHNGCQALACSASSGSCTFLGVTYNFTHIIQSPQLIGNCYPGTGSCTEGSATSCLTTKYTSSSTNNCATARCYDSAKSGCS